MSIFDITYAEELKGYNPLKQLFINYTVKLNNYYNNKSSKTPDICLTEYKNDVRNLTTANNTYKYINDKIINNAIIKSVEALKSKYIQTVSPTTPNVIRPLWQTLLLTLIFILSLVLMFWGVYQVSKSSPRKQTLVGLGDEEKEDDSVDKNINNLEEERLKQEEESKSPSEKEDDSVDKNINNMEEDKPKKEERLKQEEESKSPPMTKNQKKHAKKKAKKQAEKKNEFKK